MVVSGSLVVVIGVVWDSLEGIDGGLTALTIAEPVVLAFVGPSI